MFKNIWIGLADVLPRPGSDALQSGGAGAHVQVLARAKNAEVFQDVVKEGLGVMGFDVITFEDVELFSDRIRSYEVDETVLEAARQVDSGQSMAFGTFYTYPESEGSG